MTIQRISKNTIISYAKTIALWLKALEINKLNWDSIDVGTDQIFFICLKDKMSQIEKLNSE